MLSENTCGPPLRVLALTGPHGSGCSTVAEFFDVPGHSRTQPNDLLAILLDQEVVLQADGPFEVNWDLLNATVTQTGSRSKGRTGSLPRQFKSALESRELAHALPVLFKYYPPAGHLFRTISVSDLIVFHVMRALEARQFQVDSVNGCYHGFVGPVLEHRAKTVEGIQKALERLEIFGLRHFYADLHSERDESVQRKLVSGFGLIHGLANRVKKHVKHLHPRHYIALLQDFGNNLRRCGDPLDTESALDPQCCCLLARDVTRIIRLLHTAHSAAFFLVDSLRNPFEIICLRQQFANCFVLSLYADNAVRSERVKTAIAQASGTQLKADEAAAVFDEADRRDSGGDIRSAEHALYKQNVPKCVQLSDIAINNGLCAVSDECRIELAQRLLRPLCLILDPGCTKPTDDESFMNEAYTIAVRSNCVSRQVGAVVVGPQGYIVGAGWNDVGKGLVSCGLRAIADLRSDWCDEIVEAIAPGCNSPESLISELAQGYGHGLPQEQAAQCWFCFKDVMADKSQRPKILNALRDWIDSLDVEAEVRLQLQKSVNGFFNQVLNDVKIHQLEYCLALHAEENAILQGAKIGGMGLSGGRIYTTAEPCTLCSKKIHQVGLKEVIFTEPYPKSLPNVYMPGVVVRQFEGVKPRAYIRLFMPHHDRKEWQELCVRGLVPNI